MEICSLKIQKLKACVSIKKVTQYRIQTLKEFYQYLVEVDL